jgi:hypothetical protein
MTFCSTIIVRLYFADDGHCQLITSSSACNVEKSLDGKQNICEWNIPLEYCHFKSNTFETSNLALLSAAICVGTSCICGLLNIFIQKIEKAFLDKRHRDIQVLSKTQGSKKKTGSRREDHDLDVLDEFRGWQTIRSIFILGAVYQKMRERVDFKTPLKEAVMFLSGDFDLFLYTNRLSPYLKSNNMLPIVRVFDTCLLSTIDCFGDPLMAAYLLHSVKYGYSSRRLVVNAIIKSRSEAQIFRKILEKQGDSEMLVGTIILSRFIVNSYFGYKRFIMEYYFNIRDKVVLFDPENAIYNIENLCYCFVLFVALCGMTVTIVFLSFTIGSLSQSYWSTGVLFSFYLDQFVVCPIFCWVIGVLIPVLMIAEAQALFNAIQYQARSIMQRTRG